MVFLVDDELVRERLRAADAVAWMRAAIDAAAEGRLLAPPRVSADLDGGRLVFTTGRLAGSWFGYRSYDTFGADPGCQLVAVHDEATGSPIAVALGNEIGPRRVGAIGGVAVDRFAAADAATMAIIGTGRQAAAQVWALRAVRELRDIRVYSRDPDRRTEFAARHGIRAVADAREAVSGADIVVLATNSATPVIDADWIAPDAFVSTLGPKQHGRCEFPVALAERAARIVTDSPAQLAAYDPVHILAGTADADRITGLTAPPGPGGTLFCSVGLAGTEPYLLERFARSQSPSP